MIRCTGDWHGVLHLSGRPLGAMPQPQVLLRLTPVHPGAVHQGGILVFTLCHPRQLLKYLAIIT